MADGTANGRVVKGDPAVMNHAQRTLWAAAHGLPSDMLLVTANEMAAIKSGAQQLVASAQLAREEAAGAFHELKLRDMAIEAKEREILALKRRIHHLEHR